jgi:hypothetical protein
MRLRMIGAPIMAYSVKRQGGFEYAGIDRSEWAQAVAEHHEWRSLVPPPGCVTTIKRRSIPLSALILSGRIIGSALKMENYFLSTRTVRPLEFVCTDGRIRRVWVDAPSF